MNDRGNAPGAGTPLEGTAEGATDEFSFAEIVRVCIKWKWLTLGSPLALALAAAAYFAAFGSFVSRSSFTPQQQQGNLSALAGLASQFGLSGLTPSLTGGQSIPFYEELVKSPRLLARLAETSFAFVPAGRTDTIRGDLYTLYAIKGGTQDKRVANMVERLGNRIVVSSNVRAGVVRINVKAPFPDLAKQVNRRLLELVSEFNVQSLQSAATEERQFAEERLTSARESLYDAEQAMQRFLERNRSYQSSPELVFEAARIQRRLELQQQVFVTLSQAYEQAQIAEVRNTPVITIIDQPELTARRSRNPFVMAVVALLVGFFGAVALAIAIENAPRRWRR